VTDISIRVEGADELRRALKSVGNTGLLAALAAANENAAEIVVDARASARSGRAVADLPYAAAIHWGRKVGNVGRPPGNRKGNNPIAGRPFLWDAAQRKVPQIEPEYRDEIMQIIAEAIRRNGAAT
jgi:hypothetical protein